MDSHAGNGAIMTGANAISLLRLCAVPLAVWLVLHQRLSAAFGLFLAAGLSDAADGWLARHRGQESRLGAVLDPLADKALIASMYVTLAAVRILPDWLAILVVFRDVAIVGGVLALAVVGHPAVLRPLWVSKVNTALQLGLVAFALADAAAGWDASMAMGVLVVAVAASTVASGTLYVRRVATGMPA